jgi:hypothetical protein
MGSTKIAVNVFHPAVLTRSENAPAMRRREASIKSSALMVLEKLKQAGNLIQIVCLDFIVFNKKEFY